MATRMPQPIPYQGSKRNIAPKILRFFPSEIQTLIEPFAGSGALTIRAAFEGRASRFHLNDVNAPLMGLLEKIIYNPAEIARDYEQLWRKQQDDPRRFYDEVRVVFNRTHQPAHFLYLLARCVKASVRYNNNGDFNQGPDNRRLGRRPDSMVGPQSIVESESGIKYAKRVICILLLRIADAQYSGIQASTRWPTPVF